ncbi:oxidoreductase [Ilyonectria destructans]|nr:oxidoreductase [Ilyonectria destructans]
MNTQTMKPALGSPEDHGLPKAILCIHGAGSSGDIFRIQLTKIRAALKHEFDFVFPNGPHVSSPGPGVLPWFKDAGPYYSWFKEEDATMERRIEQINGAVQDALKQWESTKKNPHTRVVGVMAFSEGALSATLLLWQQRMNQVPWLPALHFAALFCCYFRREAAEYMSIGLRDGEKPMINVPTLHVHGKRDFCLAGARRLVAYHYLPEYAQVIEFDGTHHVPIKRDDVEETVKHIISLSRAAL